MKLTAFVRVALVALAAALHLFMAVSAQAQWAPSKPIEFVVMAGEGGGADKAVRFIAKAMTEEKLIGVPFNIVNKAGKSGGEAMAYLKSRVGDNHTIMFTLNSFYTTPLEHPELGVDIGTFAPIGRLAEDVFLLWVNSDRKDINNIDEFFKAAKAKGSEWVMAGTGLGAEDSLLTEFLNATYGLKMSYKAFKGGGEVGKELAEKRADSTVNNPSEQTEFYGKGMTKPLVTFTPQRLTAYPKTPALRETGMDFQYFMQRSVVGAPGMSKAAEAFYQNLFKRFFAGPAWQKYRKDNSLGGDFISGDALRQYWLKEREKHERWKMALEVMLMKSGTKKQ